MSLRRQSGGKPRVPSNGTKTTPGIANSTVAVTLLRYSGGAKPRSCADSVAAEEPLEIRVRGHSIAVTMRTPGHDEELAAGFLVSEGILANRAQIVAMGPCLQSDAPENTLNVFLTPEVKVDLKRLTRHVFASSSCGLCGKASIEAIRQSFPRIESGMTVSSKVLPQLCDRMRKAQETFAQTGGLHAAAVFDCDGNLVVLREDVGRHNAVDKVIGYGLLQKRLPFDTQLLLVSGRASFEIQQKALAAGIPIVCAVGAPSSLAVELARESGQTLIGFLRGRSMNVYTCPERILNR